MPHNRGMDWVRLPKRLAIYYRDSFDCVWCRNVFPIDTLGYGLTLDHLNSKKDNTSENLVTCCPHCNSSRKNLSLDEWYQYLAKKGYNVHHIKARIQRLIRKPINIQAGRYLASLRRPSYRKVYKHDNRISIK
jgi:hypothetical protein